LPDAGEIHCMVTKEDYVLAFNRGVISPYAVDRADVQRVGMAASKMMNWMPRMMGPMSLRPGLRFIGETHTVNGPIRMIPFVFSLEETALLEVTREVMRVWVDNQLVTRPAVSATITNPDFDTDLTGWTVADQGTATSVWAAPSTVQMTGTGSNGAVIVQEVTVAGGEEDTEHALRIIVLEGTLGFRVGSTSGADDIFGETQLGRGAHSIAFVPGGNFFILFFNRDIDTAVLDLCALEGPGVLGLTTNLSDTEDLDNIRFVQSGDIIFVARGITRAPFQIERRGRSSRSWSIADYRSNSGPFLPDNLTPVTVTASGTSGVVTLTASQNIFRTSEEGSLFKLTTEGQLVGAALGALDDATEPIRITGIESAREMTILIEGTWAGTVTLERSLVEPGDWSAVTTWTANTDEVFDDDLPNQIVYYRLRMTAYTSGTADVSLFTSRGQITGILRITEVTAADTATAIVVKRLGTQKPTTHWARGAWSARAGFPSAVTIHESRLFWAGRDRVWGSATDAYHNFDPEDIGDAGAIDRSIGSGPVETINWLATFRSMLLGTQASEHVCRSNGFEEPITPLNFNIRRETTYGSYPTDPTTIDHALIFVDRSGIRVMQADVSPEEVAVTELTTLVPEVCRPNVVRIGVQRRPDTRVHFVRCDGTAVVMVYDRAENVNAFVTVETRGLIEDVVVLPGSPEDQVYYVVTRNVNGTLRRYLERWAIQDHTIGGEVTALTDSYVEYDHTIPQTVLTGLDHLEGLTVAVWGDGKDQGRYPVIDGEAHLVTGVSRATAGLTYYADFISAKLGYLVDGPQAVARKRRIVKATIILRDTHQRGLKYGMSLDRLDELPMTHEEQLVDSEVVWDRYESDSVSINGTFERGAQLVLRAESPLPATVQAAVLTLEG
jgi:hypothetical protein